MPLGNRPQAEIIMKKANKKVTYYRTFNKVDTYLSYIGGLVGTLIGMIFIMGPYTEKSYEISLAKKVMKDNDHEEILSENFNLFAYLLMGLKQLLAIIGCDPNWKKTQSFIDSSEEITMQLDIAYILRKIIFLDAAVSQLMENHEI